MSSVLSSLPQPRQKANVSEAMAADSLPGEVSILYSSDNPAHTLIRNPILHAICVFHNSELWLPVIVKRHGNATTRGEANV